MPGMIEKIIKINCFHTELFAYFFDRLKNTTVKDGEGSLLDNSMIVYGSAICDGNSHSHENLPVLLAGQAGGRLNPGRRREFPKGTPMTNLYVSLLAHMDIQAEKIGDSTGSLEDFADL